MRVIILVAAVLAVLAPLAAVPAPARAGTEPQVPLVLAAPLGAFAEQARATAERLAAESAVQVAAEARRLARIRAEARRRAALRRLRRSRTVAGALRRALLQRRLSEEAHLLLRAEEAEARRVLGGLQGTPRAELAAVLGVLDALAAQRRLTPSRLPAAFLVLRHNTRFWRDGRIPVPSERIEVEDGAVVLQYYPGRGLQLQPLASWGRANARARVCLEAVRAGRNCRADELRRVVDRLVGLGSRRSGYLAWEHFFAWGGGTPPWVSGMTQATAVQALARAARALGDDRYAAAAEDALGAFELPPPAGVAVPERGGTHHLMYSFAPGLRIFNGALQAVSGLRDAAALLRSPRARRLFRASDRAARAAVAAADTGAWSLYSESGRESTLGYHQLTRTFLGRLCASTRRRTYCAAERRFARYESEPPELRLTAVRGLRPGRTAALRLWVSKLSTVRLRAPGGPERVLWLPRGAHVLTWTPRRSGRARLAIVARGVSGPAASLEREVRVRAPRRPRRGRSRPAARPRPRDAGRAPRRDRGGR